MHCLERSSDAVFAVEYLKHWLRILLTYSISSAAHDYSFGFDLSYIPINYTLVSTPIRDCISVANIIGNNGSIYETIIISKLFHFIRFKLCGASLARVHYSVGHI